jgi:hypothetical protein
MDNYEKLQFAAKQISKLIRLEQVWRQAQIVVEGEVVAEIGPAVQTKLKQKFASIRTKCIAALNGVTP